MTAFSAMVASRKLQPLPPDTTDLRQSLLAALKPFAGQACVLGLSGGLDSVVLLDLLAQVAPTLQLRPSLVHVNHQLSPFAADWQQFCVQLAQQYQLPITVQCVQLQRKGGESLEAVARDARYRVYASLGADVLLLAHHLDDQCETLLLRLLRGAGVHGLSGMPQQRLLAGTSTTLLRPLLGVGRAELQQYAEARQLRWVSDESNDDPRFRRNWLRHSVFPLLASVFPNYRRQLAQTAQHLDDAARILDQVAQADFVGDLAAARLQLDALAQLGEERQRNLLRWFLRQYGLIPSVAWLAQLRQQMLTAEMDACPALQIDDWMLERYRGCLYLHRSREMPSAPCIDLRWNGEAEIRLDQWAGRFLFHTGKGPLTVAEHYLRAAPLQVRLRQGGERLRPAAQAANRQLKHLLQESAMPPWQRRGWPLLWQGEQLLAVPGVAVAAEFQPQNGESGVLIEWQPDAPFMLQRTDEKTVLPAD